MVESESHLQPRRQLRPCPPSVARCDTVIYNRKYILGLQIFCFWRGAPKTSGLSKVTRESLRVLCCVNEMASESASGWGSTIPVAGWNLSADGRFMTSPQSGA